MATITTEALQLVDNHHVYNSAFLKEAADSIYNTVNVLKLGVDSTMRAIAETFARVAAEPEELAKDGYKSVKEFGSALGFKSSTVYSLTAAGKMYLDSNVPNTLKQLPPSKLRELSNVLTRCDDMTMSCMEEDADRLATMTQKELRDYASKAVAMFNDHQLDGYHRSILDADYTPGDDTTDGNAVTGKVKKLYTLNLLRGDAKLQYISTDDNGNSVHAVFDLTTDETDTMDGWKTAFNQAGFKLAAVGAGVGDTTRYTLVSDFNEIALVKFVESNNARATTVTLSVNEVQQLAQDLAAGLIDYAEFERQINANKK